MVFGGGRSRSLPAPHISIVIPAHNAEGTIAEQLAALSPQATAPGVEVIVALNRCTDGTEAVVQSFQARMPNLEIVQADERQGAAHARNRGHRRARGDYVLHCDADDIVGPNWVEAMVRGLADADAVGGRLEPFGWPDGCEAAQPHQRDELGLSDKRLRFIVSASLGYRRSLGDQVPFLEEIATGEDIDFSFRIQQLGARVAFVPDAVCRYRARPTWDAAHRQMRGYGRADVVVALRNDPEQDPGILKGLASLGVVTARSVFVRDGCERRRWSLVRSWCAARLREHLRHRRAWLATRAPDAPSGLTRTLGETGRQLGGSRVSVVLSPWTSRLDAYQPMVPFTMDPRHPTLGGRPGMAPLSIAEGLATAGHGQTLDEAALVELGIIIRPRWTPAR